MNSHKKGGTVTDERRKQLQSFSSMKISPHYAYNPQQIITKNSLNSLTNVEVDYIVMHIQNVRLSSHEMTH